MKKSKFKRQGFDRFLDPGGGRKRQEQPHKSKNKYTRKNYKIYYEEE